MRQSIAQGNLSGVANFILRRVQAAGLRLLANFARD